MAETIKHKNCPVCGQTDLQFVLKAKDHLVTEELFEIWECRACTFQFTQNVPDAESIGSYYESEDYISHSSSQESFIDRIYSRARSIMLHAKHRIICKHLSDEIEKNVLDVGSGMGHFLKTMKAEGWSVAGIEPNQKAREFADMNFGVESKNSYHLFSLEKEVYSAITFWHSLEHIHDLHETLNQVAYSLREEGVLCIAVPNNQANEKKRYAENWAAWDVPRHLWHFNVKSMETLLSKHGFQVVKKIGMPFDPFYISLISEKYLTGKEQKLKALGMGLQTLFRGMIEMEKNSSIIYIVKKKSALNKVKVD